MTYPNGSQINKVLGTEAPNQSLWARINEPEYDVWCFASERACWMLGGAVLALIIFTAGMDRPNLMVRDGCTQTVTDGTIVLVCGRDKR